MALIFVIDDDRQIRAMIGRVLGTAGHSLLDVHDGHEGLRVLLEQHPSMVITDILMPTKEGIETIVEIRRAAPTTRIVAISGGGRVGNLDFLDVAQKLGADAVLAKPSRAAELIGTVGRLLGGDHQGVNGDARPDPQGARADR